MALLLTLYALWLSVTVIKGVRTDLPEAYSRRNQLRDIHYGAAVSQSHLIRTSYAYDTQSKEFE